MVTGQSYLSDGQPDLLDGMTQEDIRIREGPQNKSICFVHSFSKSWVTATKVNFFRKLNQI